MKTLNNEELISFCSQMSMILHAGISTIEGLAIMKEDLPGGEGKKILEDLYEKMEYSGNLSESMRETKVFPDYICNMTEIGEQTGRLDEVMEGLAAHYESEQNLSETIKGALFYPAVMLGILTAVILILVVKVMPVFQKVLQQLGGGLTGVSAGIFRAGEVFGRYSIVFVILLVVLAAAMAYVGLTEKGKEMLHKWTETSRLTRNLSEKIAGSRVAEGLSLCLFSGLDLDQSLEMTEKLITHSQMKTKIANCRELIQTGSEFDQALTQSKVFPGLYGKMICVGIRTGAMDQVMKKIAEEYKEDVEEMIQKKVAVVEPTLVAVLSLIVGMILISVMLPLMSIMTNLG